MVNKIIITRNKARPHPVTGHKRALYLAPRQRVYRYIYIPYWGGRNQFTVKS